MSVPVKRKRPKPGPKRNFKPEVAVMNGIHECQKALRELVRTGGISDPDLAARIEAGWNPAIELVVLSTKFDLPDPVRTVVLKVLLEHVAISATDRARLDAAVESPAHISINIAGWAAGQRGPSAVDVKAAVDVPAIDYTSSDRPSMHRSSPPPEDAPEQASFVEMTMVRDGGGVLRPVPIEQPKPEGWRPRRYTYNQNTGTYDVVED